MQTILKNIPFDEIKDSQLLLEYYYLQGFVMIFQNASLMDCLFTFEKLLFEEQKYTSDIYRLLAFTGIGMAYAKEGEIEKAEFYFNKVFKEIYLYTIQSMEDTWRVLNVVFHCGVFYAEKGDLETSDALLEYAISICSDNHVTYYLARAAFQLAKNALAEEKPQEQILELLQDARAYAKINKNRILLEAIQTLKETILSKNN